MNTRLQVWKLNCEWHEQSLLPAACESRSGRQGQGVAGHSLPSRWGERPREPVRQEPRSIRVALRRRCAFCAFLRPLHLAHLAGVSRLISSPLSGSLTVQRSPLGKNRDFSLARPGKSRLSIYRSIRLRRLGRLLHNGCVFKSRQLGCADSAGRHSRLIATTCPKQD